MKKIVRCTLCLLLCCLTLAAAAMPAMAEAPTHGTTNEWITEDRLKNTPPADYEINPDTQGEAREGRYNDWFLEDTVQTVSIEIENVNLNYLLQNADKEPYVMTQSVTIGDTTLGYCGLRTKGSYTLAAAYTGNPRSDRFSFTVNFGKYIKKADYGEKQNFYGCDKISFNNFFFDKSMMKEFFALKLMDEMGLPTPQYGLARLYINGQYYGVYAMIETMDTPILEQYYDVDKKELSDYLCKPEGTRLQYDDLLEDNSPLWENDEDTLAEVEPMLPTVMEWVRRLNCLSEGTDFEGGAIDVNSDEYIALLSQIMELDEAVRYFAVHSWLCQMDNMFVGEKNYGLYISEEGKATLVPWDYDLSFGCYYPSTAETTANYDIDVMYRLGDNVRDQEEEFSQNTYARFPLFNVIYQNEQLMAQYHEYMKECSMVAALGGTVASTGKSYEPGFFNSFIERMEEEIIAAASEELAPNVYYMNWINQPRDVRRALPNLAQIIALRAVGVYTQVEGIETTVCASGCNLETLGNASEGWSSNSGVLTTVDDATGIFVTAEYEGGRRSSPPGLTVYRLDEEDSTVDDIRAAMLCTSGDIVSAYEFRAGVKAVSDTYTVTLPLTQAELAGGMVHGFYVLEDGRLTPLNATADGSLYTVEVEALGTIVIISRQILPIAAAAGGVLAVLAAAIVLPIALTAKRRRAKRQAKKADAENTCAE